MDKEPDLSTLGGDWDAQDSIGQGDDESLSLAHSQTQPSPETKKAGAFGDVSAEDIAEDSKTYFSLNKMVATEEKAEALIALIDVEQKGTINFDEFCKFIVLLKQGDARFTGFANLITKIGESPMFELERQKLRNNEIGTLMEKNGQPAEILDFFKCRAPLDEEKLDPHTSVSEVIRILTKSGANVNIIDRIGRTALHYAAKNGHTIACSHLVRKGATIFAADFHARKDATFDEVAAEVFAELPTTKLSQAELRKQLVGVQNWESTRKAAVLRRTFNQHWQLYEDPDTDNFFYTRAPTQPKKIEKYNNFGWVRSTFLRAFNQWEAYRCNKTNLEYYFKKSDYDISFEDCFGNIFYHNVSNDSCEWERPHDAVEVTPAEKLCTYFLDKSRPTLQRWYSCEQCNRVWKTASSSSDGNSGTATEGHKGVRLIKESPVQCNCGEVCAVVAETVAVHKEDAYCKACVISKTEKKVTSFAESIRLEQKRHRQLLVDMPPVFALVPRFEEPSPESNKPNSKLKLASGWMICRKTTPGLVEVRLWGSNQGLVTVKEESDSSDDGEDEEGQKKTEEASVGFASVSSVDTADLPDQNTGQGVWVELFDPEDREQLKYGDRVICLRHTGTVEAAADNHPEILLPYTHRLLRLVKRSDYGGPECLQLFLRSTLRRGFENYDEMYCRIADLTYYIDNSKWAMIKGALTLQGSFRQRHCKPLPLREWACDAFSFDVPDEVYEEMMVRCGWAYLSELVDSSGVEWEEYCDKNVTSEYFYWDEEANMFQWQKPDVFIKPDASVIETFEVDSEVMYRFAGRPTEEKAVVTRIRKDDQTGEDMYDLVHRYAPETQARWVSRHEVKSVPKEGEDLKLANMEIKWKMAIRKKRDQDERKAKLKKLRDLDVQKQEMENVRLMALRNGANSDSDSSVERKLSAMEMPMSTPRSLRRRKVDGMTNQQYHEQEECHKRLVVCPLQCLEWVVFEDLGYHMDNLCTKRPAKPLECRRDGVGNSLEGQSSILFRLKMIDLNMKPRSVSFVLDEHRDYHLDLLGAITFCVPGTYTYKVPKGLQRLKIQLWGGGGGSGHFINRQGGNGGGGAFVEAIVKVDPFNVLEIVVGSGGGGGVSGTSISVLDKEELLQRFKAKQNNTLDMDSGSDVIDSQCGVSLGGQPGGGDGYGGGHHWASGGGGGYSIVSKRTHKGSQVLLVAAGGGGGASLDGLPGSGLDGTLKGVMIDPINGTTATVQEPGSLHNTQWAATPGSMWQGGSGCEFGGGGTMPGISGGGGGGSSYVFVPLLSDYVCVSGHGVKPGGLSTKPGPPLACGLGDWDKTGGLAGQGGQGDKVATHSGNAGAVRILKPGHY
eukprot:gene26472-35131_t